MKTKRVRKSEPVTAPSVDLERRAAEVLLRAGVERGQIEALRASGKFWDKEPNPNTEFWITLPEDKDEILADEYVDRSKVVSGRRRKALELLNAPKIQEQLTEANNKLNRQSIKESHQRQQLSVARIDAAKNKTDKAELWRTPAREYAWDRWIGDGELSNCTNERMASLARQSLKTLGFGSADRPLPKFRTVLDALKGVKKAAKAAAKTLKRKTRV